MGYQTRASSKQRSVIGTKHRQCSRLLSCGWQLAHDGLCDHDHQMLMKQQSWMDKQCTSLGQTLEGCSAQDGKTAADPDYIGFAMVCSILKLKLHQPWAKNAGLEQNTEEENLMLDPDRE